MTLVEICTYQRVEKPTMSRAINRLEEQNIVEQVPSKDKREKRIHLTPQGKKLYAEVRITIDRFEIALLEGFSEKQQLESIQMMEEVRKKLLK